VINRAFNAGIGIVEVGNNRESSIKAVELAKKHPDKIRATVGCHPHHWEEFNYEFFKNLAENLEVAAIGECGLDYAVFAREQSERLQKRASRQSAGLSQKVESIKNFQKDIFIEHIKLAKEVSKPLMIHCREAFDDLMEILNSKSPLVGELNSLPGILHFFTGTLENAKQFLEMGFYFTFNGLITFNRDFDEIIKYIPLDRILLETDAPYVAPLPYRGRRNEPVYIVETAKKMAEIKGVSFEKISGQTTENAMKIFNY
jgi:TatD DNase family protein